MRTDSYGYDPGLRSTPEKIAGGVPYERVSRLMHGTVNGRKYLLGQHGEAVTMSAEEWEEVSRRAAAKSLQSIMGEREMVMPQTHPEQQAPTRLASPEETVSQMQSQAATTIEESGGLDPVAILRDIDAMFGPESTVNDN